MPSWEAVGAIGSLIGGAGSLFGGTSMKQTSQQTTQQSASFNINPVISVQSPGTSPEINATQNPQPVSTSSATQQDSRQPYIPYFGLASPQIAQNPSVDEKPGQMGIFNTDNLLFLMLIGTGIYFIFGRK